MAEVFLLNIAERVLEKIAYLSIEEARLALNVETDLSELKEIVSSIKAVLLDAEQKQHQNEKLRLYVSQKECKTVNHQTELIDKNVRHLSFGDEKLLKVPQLKKLKNVRTVIIHGVLEESLINLCVSKYKYLRVLRLCDSHSTALPYSIGILKHLRDLDLTNCRRIKKLPSSFYWLQSLQTLRMRGVPLLQLPDNLESLIELRYLEITIKAPHLKEIRSGCWPSLQYLAFHDCDNLERLFEGIQHLTSLRGLVLDNCPNLVTLPRSLKFLTKLEDLCVSWCNKINLEMEPEEEDRNLQLSLKTFLLSDSDELTDLPRLLLERSSSTLQQIKISNCSNFVVLPPWLQHLVVQNCQLYRREWTRSPNTRKLPIFVLQI
ncbi:hypothetical protein V6N13_067688 [Hibiscus sabdariffa]